MEIALDWWKRSCSENWKTGERSDDANRALDPVATKLCLYRLLMKRRRM
jgi:hypothetical protein